MEFRGFIQNYENYTALDYTRWSEFNFSLNYWIKNFFQAFIYIWLLARNGWKQLPTSLHAERTEKNIVVKICVL